MSGTIAYLPPSTDQLAGVVLRELGRDEVGAGGRTMSVGMRDNPIHVGVWPDPRGRDRALRATFVAGMERPGRTALCAVVRGEVVGVAGVATRGSCRPRPAQSAALAERLAAVDAGAIERWRQWRGAWSAHDPEREHWHFGPFAVTPEYRGRGLGCALLAYYCRGLDAAAVAGYLEVDDAANVGLYERFGFEVVAEETVIGVPCWFMLRPAR